MNLLNHGRSLQRTAIGAALAGLAAILLAPLSAAALGLPHDVSAQTRYLFYLHGSWLETKGLDARHPRYGRYRFNDIVAALRGRGFEVISEVRSGRVRTRDYAKMVASRVTELIARGVPPDHIAVIGHSKGGQMALETAAIVGDRTGRHVVMAGCALADGGHHRGYEKFLESRAARMRGRMLSLYDRADDTTGTCEEAFSAASLAGRRETVLETGRGHGLFYAPDPAWIEPVVDWIR